MISGQRNEMFSLMKPDLWDAGTPVRFGHRKCVNSMGTLKTVRECLRSPSAPPLDFAFHGLQNLDDMVYVKQKRDGQRAENEGAEGKEGGGEDTLGGTRKSRKRLTVRALKLGNNQITEVSTLDSALDEISVNPSDLTWLDLSYNKLTTIDEVIAKFPNLRTLYLHANGITKLNDIAKLADLQSLKQLTLHGNPCADAKDYRLFVIDALPGLHQLDFSLVTNQNRDNAYTWRTHNLKRLKNLDKKLQIKTRQVQPSTWKTPALANKKKETLQQRLAVTSIPSTPGTHKRIAASGLLAETF
jgi:hypothetical protein